MLSDIKLATNYKNYETDSASMPPFRRTFIHHPTPPSTQAWTRQELA